MTILIPTFKFYEDEELETEYGSTLTTTHKTDLSDGAHDYEIFFGSTLDTLMLRVDADFGTPGTDPIVITPTDVIPPWVAATLYSEGAIREPTTPNGNRYRVKSGGTSHATTEPTWPTSGVGSTVADGSAIWELMGIKHPITEVKLALLQADLGSAVAGAELDIGHTILGGVDEAISFWMRITNTVQTVSTGTDIALFINEVQEEYL